MERKISDLIKEKETEVKKKLGKIKILNEENPEKINDNLIKIIRNEGLIWNSYKKIKSNKQVTVTETNKETFDGFKAEIVKELETEIVNGYKKRDMRKKRLLEISSFSDKIVQENIRIVLSIIYEPLFQMLDVNHSFRPNRNIETAMEKIKAESQGVTTIIKGHSTITSDKARKERLIEIMKKKINDKIFLKMIQDNFDTDILNKDSNRKFKNKEREQQSNVVSPILFNIMMHTFDKKVIELTEELLKKKNEVEKRISKPKVNKRGEVKTNISNLKRSVKKIKEYNNVNKLKKFLIEKKKNAILFFSYIRYASDWLLMTNADIKTSRKIKEKLKEWARNNLEIEIHDEKISITDINKNQVKFLGFTIYKKENRVAPYQYEAIKRKLNLKLAIGCDREKILNKLKNENVINKKNFPTHVNKYTTLQPWQIVENYNKKIKGLIEYYYHILTNKSALNYIYHILKFSCYKTLANRQKSTIKSILLKYGPETKVKYNEIKINKKGEEISKEKEIKIIRYTEIMRRAEEMSQRKTKKRILIRKLEKRIGNEIEIHKKSQITEANNLIDIIENYKERNMQELTFNLR